MTLWNRYSSGCRSNWARAQLSSAAVGAGYKLQIAIATKDSRGVNEYICYPGPSNTGLTYVACTSSYTGSSIIYGDMVDGTNLTQAFAEVFNSAGALIDIVEADQ